MSRKRVNQAVRQEQSMESLFRRVASHEPGSKPWKREFLQFHLLLTGSDKVSQETLKKAAELHANATGKLSRKDIGTLLGQAITAEPVSGELTSKGKKLRQLLEKSTPTPVSVPNIPVDEFADDIAKAAFAEEAGSVATKAASKSAGSLPRIGAALGKAGPALKKYGPSAALTAATVGPYLVNWLRGEAGAGAAKRLSTRMLRAQNEQLVEEAMSKLNIPPNVLGALMEQGGLGAVMQYQQQNRLLDTGSEAIPYETGE